MMEYGKPSTYVVFTDSNFKPLQLLKPGFQHVFLWHWNGYIWIHIDNNLIKQDTKTVDQWNKEPIPLNTNIVERFLAEEDALALNLRNTDEMLDYYYRHPTLINSMKKALAPNTCVTAIKNFLGINNLMIQTPYQLYKELKQWA